MLDSQKQRGFTIRISQIQKRFLELSFFHQVREFLHIVSYDGQMQLIVALVVLERWIACQDGLEIILKSPLVVWLPSRVGDGGVHATE